MFAKEILDSKIHVLEDSMKKRGVFFDKTPIQNLIASKKTINIQVQKMRAQRNLLSSEIAKKGVQNKNSVTIYEEAKRINQDLEILEQKLEQISYQLEHQLLELPNLVDDSVSELEDKVIRLGPTYHQKLTYSKSQDIKTHIQIGRTLDQLDFSIASKIAKSRFPFLKGDLARLHRALGQFMLDTHVFEHNYQELYVPYIVNKSSLYGTGQLPKFEEGLFHVEEDLALIPTGEVSIANSMRDTIVEEVELPIKLTAHTPCFRKEAGSYGKDNQGLIRQHQFDKVELFQITTPEQARFSLEEITSHAEVILQKLELPYRVIEIGSTNLGFSACKSYDLEVELPSQKSYLEISSCSWCSDFQSRRINSRFRTQDKNLKFTHMLNGSGLAVGRTLLTIMEHYQLDNNRISIPEVLQPYMKNQKVIE